MPEIPVCGCYNFPQSYVMCSFHTTPLWHPLTLALDKERVQALVCWHQFSQWRAYWSQSNRVQAVELINAPIFLLSCPSPRDHSLHFNLWGLLPRSNYINPGSQIPQVEARKRCSCDLFTSSGRATALINRHFWYTFLQQSMTPLTNNAILLTSTLRFHWRFSGNWQEHICERNTRCFGSPSHLSLGSNRLNVTVCRTCTVPLWDVQRTGRSWNYWKNILGWLALRSSSYPHHISIPPSYLV